MYSSRRPFGTPPLTWAHPNNLLLIISLQEWNNVSVRKALFQTPLVSTLRCQCNQGFSIIPPPLPRSILTIDLYGFMKVSKWKVKLRLIVAGLAIDFLIWDERWIARWPWDYWCDWCKKDEQQWEWNFNVDTVAMQLPDLR